MLLLSAERTPLVEEVIISMNSTVLLSITLRLQSDEFVMSAGTVRVTWAMSPLLLKERRPSASAVMFPSSWSSIKNVYIVVSWPAQSSSLCTRRGQCKSNGMFLTININIYSQFVCIGGSQSQYSCLQSYTFCSNTFNCNFSSPTSRVTFKTSARPGPI